MNYYFSQAIYGSDSYSTSEYSAGTQTQQQGGLTNTGEQVMWGSITGAAIIIIAILLFNPLRSKIKNKRKIS